MQSLKNTLDYNEVRKSIVRAMMASLGLDQNHAITQEGEDPNAIRPTLPYMDMKITVPGTRYGDDSKISVVEDNVVTTKVISTGPRKMTVVFNAYAESHEDAYNLMSLWQSALDEETVQEYLRSKGIAVLIIGSVDDISELLNTGYEGRANMDCQFGLTSSVTSDLGAIEEIGVEGKVDTLKTVEDLNVEI